jgi:hypothetical protein
MAAKSQVVRITGSKRVPAIPRAINGAAIATMAMCAVMCAANE